jgi:serine/threonine protein kinase
MSSDEIIISKNIYTLLTDRLFYSESDCESIISILNELKNKFGGNMLANKSSSGNSILLIFENFVFKIYNKSHKDKAEKEYKILNKLRDCGCVKILHYMISPCIIVYETLNSSINYNSLNIDEIKTFIFDIATALECLHSKNCVHRDVAHTNICYRESDRKYVLIDFENSIDFDSESQETKCDKQECMYMDVRMFLEDLDTKYRSSIEITNYISILLDRLKTNCETVTEVKKMFLGKEKIRRLSEIKYKPDVFLKILNSL